VVLVVGRLVFSAAANVGGGGGAVGAGRLAVVSDLWRSRFGWLLVGWLKPRAVQRPRAQPSLPPPGPGAAPPLQAPVIEQLCFTNALQDRTRTLRHPVLHRAYRSTTILLYSLNTLRTT
jgi:hypothetical protein